MAEKGVSVGLNQENWRAVGAALSVSPYVQRLALVLCTGVLSAAALSSGCDAIPRDDAAQVWAFAKSISAASSDGSGNLPFASESEVFEILDALAAGFSVDEIAFCIGRPAVDCWALIASTV